MLNLRKIVLSLLLSVGNDYGYSNLVLSDAFKKQDYSSRDRGFITALFYGVLDRKITLDYIISNFTDKPVKRIKPVTINSLRMALFQILYMDSVPDSAAVDESVKLVKNSKEKYNAAFVNALLRNFLRNRPALPDGNTSRELSIRYSCPMWIIESLISDYGTDNAVAVLKHYLFAPKTTLRINPLLISDDEFAKRLIKSGVDVTLCDIPHAAMLNDGVDVTALPEYREGLFHVEDLPSQIAVSYLELKPGARILDMCAAPGGKTFTVAENSSDSALITACDIFGHRVDLIKAGAKRLNINSVDAKVFDSCVFDGRLGEFDAVICDVPCSGLGVIRRKPEIKYKEDLDFDTLENTQRQILSNGIKYLKAGGTLLYSTCTLRKRENEDIVRHCIKDNDRVSLYYEHTFLPGVDLTDGFYFAILKSR